MAVNTSLKRLALTRAVFFWGGGGELLYPYIKALSFEEQAFKVGLIKGIEELTRL